MDALPARYRGIPPLLPGFHYVGSGPQFFDLAKIRSNETNDSNFTEEFEITILDMVDRVNELSMVRVTATIPTDLLKKTKSKDTTDFFATQMFKHVTLRLTRPDPIHVPKELFQLETWYHGIVASVDIEREPHGDVAVMELRPYFWRLTLQNNYRSFANLNVRDIFKKIFELYQQEGSSEKFVVRYEFDPRPPRIQVVQMGESDYDFILRLMKEEGLSYFFSYNDKTSILVITNNIVATYSKIEKECKDIEPGVDKSKKPLSYVAMVGDEIVPHSIEGKETPLHHLNVQYVPPSAQINIRTNTDFRVVETLSRDVGQDQNLAILTDGFKPKWMTLSSTTSYLDTAKDKREEQLDLEAKNFLAREYAANLRRSGQTSAFAFIPIWRSVSVDPGFRRQTNYVSGFVKSENFKIQSITHHFARIPTEYLPNPIPAHAQAQRPVFYHLQVGLEFFDATDDSFKPPLLHSPSFTSGMREAGRAFSAVVVDFKADDKTENNYDVPNTIRVRFPWHKSDESIRARASFFWAADGYGSVFLPEVGSEVFVVFPDGDKDYPVIIGSCYNAKNNYPLRDVKKREADGEFAARGIFFKDREAEFVLKTVKDNNGKTTQIFNLVTSKGNLAMAASNIDVTAEEKFTLTATTSKSTFIMDSTSVAVVALDDATTLSFKKNEMKATSKAAIVLSSDSEVQVKAPTIQLKASGMIEANSLTLPG